MKRRTFLSVVPAALAAGSCARMDQRGPRYDESECPFCSTDPGVCSYCHGETKCTFCKGKGTRTTIVPRIEEEGVMGTSYQEPCQYCGETGTCRYCRGSGKCWACGGSGKVESWDFYERYQKLIGKES